MSRRGPGRRMLAAAVVLLLAGCSASATGGPAPKGELLGPYPVTRVVDGDTIWVQADGGRLKVRLIGIDTAETVAPNRPVGCFGPEASAQTARLLDGEQVHLELDPSQGDTDRYGRTLAYVWLDDGRMVNELLVRNGFAVEYTYDDPYAYQAEFRDAQRQAQAADAGRWAACPTAGSGG